MGYEASIEADSVSRRDHRLTTFSVVLPRIMLAEFNTHRVLSRNSSSSRAIPVHRQLRALLRDMFMPETFGTAIGGMNAGPALSGVKLEKAKRVWRDAAMNAIESSLMLTTSPDYIEETWLRASLEDDQSFEEFVLDIASKVSNKESGFMSDESFLKTSKGLTNRLLEPFMYHHLITTGTEWDNFFNLRTHKDAQEEIRTAAIMMQEVFKASAPKLLEEGEWHMPFVKPEESIWVADNPQDAPRVASARAARTSYKTHDTPAKDLNKPMTEEDRQHDLSRAAGLSESGHMSPFEHVGTPIPESEWVLRDQMRDLVLSNAGDQPGYVIDQLVESTQFSANFRGWAQYRRQLRNERVFQGTTA